MSNEKLTRSYKANKSLSPKLAWINDSRIRLEFWGSCLIQEDKAPFTPSNGVHLFIVYELNRWSKDLDAEFTLRDCLFGNVKMILINIVL